MRRTIYSLLFVLTLIQNVVGQMNCASNTCQDAEQLTADTPNSCEDGEIINVKHSCLGAATPNLEIERCGIDSLPTVWFKIQATSTDARQLVTKVDADGFNPIWSIYEGTDCGSLELVEEREVFNGLTLSYACSFSDSVAHDNHITTIQDDPITFMPKSYWIAISGFPLAGEDVITNDDFTLFYSASLGCLACSGDNAFDCDNGDFTATVDGEFYDPDGDGVAGPFCPGQEVEVCFSFYFDTTGNGNDWLHGLIPTLGSGWDVQSINFATQYLGDSSWVWYEMGEECYPRLNGASMPNLCTYEEDGVLKLCNTTCNPSCPCAGEQPLEDGSILPSGWFWNSPACGDGDCPHEEYGVPSGSSVNVSACLTLKVKTFNSIEDFQSQDDLQIYIQPTSDAVTGCWMDSNPCTIDPSVNSPKWRVAYFDIPQVELTESTICNGESVGFELNNNLDDDYDILIVPIPNEDVDGAMTQDLDAVQSFSIQDSLINNSNEIQMQSYEVNGFGTGANCNSFSDTLMVFVYPDISFNFADLVLCPGDTYSVNALENTEGGTENYVSTLWSPTLSIDPILLISDQSINQYCVTVTDDFGCTGSTCFDVQFEMQPSLELIDTAEVCNMAIGDAMTAINLNDYLLQASNGSWNSLDGITIDNDKVDFIGAELGSYAFEFSTSSAVEPCVNVTDTLVVEVVECSCPILDITSAASICMSDTETFDLASLIIQAEEGTWSLTDGNTLSLEESLVSFTGAESGQYVFVYTLDDPILGCTSSQEVTVTLVSENNAELVNERVVCNVSESNSAFILDFTSFVLSGNTEGTWTDTDASGVDLSDLTSVSFLGLPIGEIYTFTYTIENQEPCIDHQYSVEIMIVDCNCPPVNAPDLGIDTICSSAGIVYLGSQWSSNEVDIQEGVLVPFLAMTGDYELIYTLADSLLMDGCPSKDTTQIYIINILPDIDVSSISCFGASDGEISLVLDDPEIDYNIQWFDGSDEVTRNDLPAGTYNVSISDPISSCIESVDIQLNQPSELLVEIIYENDSLNVIVEGGEMQYNYEWNTGAISPSIVPLQTGVYSVTVTDANNCQVTNSFEFVGLEELAWGINIYPNPFTDQIIVVGEVDNIENIRMFDPLGRMVNINVNQEYQQCIIGVDQPIVGVYYLEVITEKQSYFKRLVYVGE